MLINTVLMRASRQTVKKGGKAIEKMAALDENKATSAIMGSAGRKWRRLSGQEAK